MRTVTLVTMQPIPVDMLTTSKICVAVANWYLTYLGMMLIFKEIEKAKNKLMDICGKFQFFIYVDAFNTL